MWWRCFIRGENLPGELVDKAEPVGFYVTRFVEADSADAAEEFALSLLQDDNRFNTVATAIAAANSRIYFEEIELIDQDEVPDVQPGFAFYQMSSD